MAPTRFPRPLLASALLASGLVAACSDEPSGPDLTPVTAGTIDGVAFSVAGGTVLQAGSDGPLFADESGGRILFDQDPAGLGMSDPDLLHVRARFALSDGGSIQVVAYGDAGSEFNTGVGVGLLRDGSAIHYEVRFAGAVARDGVFAVPSQLGGAEYWMVTELYADSVPGQSAGQAGAALWPLDDLTPTPAEEVLGCPSGPPTDPNPLSGDAVGFELDGSWLLSVEVVDPIVGPCP